mgnify:CR=1 FL=1
MANFSFAQNYGATLTSPFISSPYVRNDLPVILDKFRTARTRYTVSTADTQSPFTSGQFSLLWDTPFADLNYSYWVSLRDVTPIKSAVGRPSVVYSVGLCSPSVDGLKGFLYCPYGQGGDVVGLDVLAIHD